MFIYQVVFNWEQFCLLDIWQCLETSLVVRRGGCFCHLVGRGQHTGQPPAGREYLAQMVQNRS